MTEHGSCCRDRRVFGASSGSMTASLLPELRQREVKGGQTRRVGFRGCNNVRDVPTLSLHLQPWSCT